MNKPHVSVIVVGWNSIEDLPECFDALSDQSYDNYQIIFVDNDSSDDSVKLVKENYPNIEILQLPTNTHFTGGHNAGMKHAYQKYQSEFIAIINPDAVCESNWISSQVKIMEKNQRIGALGPKVVFALNCGPEGQKTTQSQTIINTVGILPGGFLFPYDRGFGEVDQGQFDYTQEVYSISGVSMMMRSSVLAQTGLFFEPLQMYLEDVELCHRMQNIGYEIWYTGDTTVHHKYMKSTKKAGSNRHKIWSRTNYLIFVFKQYPARKFLRALWETFRELPINLFALVLYRFLTKFWRQNTYFGS